MKPLVTIFLVFIYSTVFGQSNISGQFSVSSDSGIKVLSAWFTYPSDAAAELTCGFSDKIRHSRIGKADEFKSWCPDTIQAHYFHSMIIAYSNNVSEQWYTWWNDVESDEDLFHHTLGTTAGYGNHDGTDGDLTDCTDSSQAWSDNYWIGKRIVNTTDGSSCVATDSTNDDIICSGGLEGGTNNDWSTNDVYNVDRHPDSTGNTQFYADESNTDWAAQVITWLNAITSDFDEHYFDVMRPRWPTWESVAPAGYVATDFEVDKKYFADTVGAGLNRPVILNSLNPIYELSTETTPGDWFINVAGSQCENCFSFAKNSSTFSKSDCETHFSNIIAIRNMGKHTDCLTRPNSTDTTTRMSIVVLFHIIKYEHAYLNINPGEESTNKMSWFPEYGINIGGSLETFDNISEAVVQTYFWQRKYRYGLAIFNFDGTDRTYTTTGNYSKAVINGGGEITDGNLPAGNLTWESVSFPLTITAETGVILRKN